MPGVLWAHGHKILGGSSVQRGGASYLRMISLDISLVG